MKSLKTLYIPVVMLLASCGNDNDGLFDKDDNVRRNIIEYTGQKESFEWKLLGEVSGNSDNVAISPLGIEYVLAMTANGANSETAGEIINTIFSEDVDIDELNTYYGNLANTIVKLDNKVSFISHNMIWADECIQVYEDYISKMSDIYGTGFNTSPKNEMVNDINEWCNESTNGIISKIIDQPHELVILNVSGLKAGWSLPFDKTLTKRSVFHGTKAVTADFMCIFETMNYCSNDVYDLVSKDLGDGNFSFNIILPKEGVSVAQCLRHLESNTPDDKLKKGNVSLRLPKFSVSFCASMSDYLRNMGIHRAFDKQLSFPGISPASLQLCGVNQSNVIRIDESGIDVASVSDAEFMFTSPDRHYTTSLELTVDRPFIYYIKENSNNIVLYSGVVKTPE